MKFEKIKKTMQQPIDSKEVFIEIKKYIHNNLLEKDIDILRNQLKKCKSVEALFLKFRTKLEEEQYF